MTQKLLYIIRDDKVRSNAMQSLQTLPVDWVVRMSPATRSLEQNSKLHAIFGDVAKQLKYHGRVLTATQWKTLFISGHAIATGLGADMIPGLESEFINIRESSATMTVSRMASLIEYVMAYGAEHVVAWSDESKYKRNA